MQSKLVYVPKSDINQATEIFQLLKKMNYEDLIERCKSLSMCQPILTPKLIPYKNTINCTGITITHHTGFIAIEGCNLSDIIEAAWMIDTGKTFEDNLIDEIKN